MFKAAWCRLFHRKHHRPYMLVRDYTGVHCIWCELCNINFVVHDERNDK